MGSPWRAIGVDWDSGSWVAVGYTDGAEPGVDVYEEIATLWEEHGSAADRIVVDIPIGLCESRAAPGGCVETAGELSRRCDDLARTVLGPRSSSVFTAPCRAAARQVANGGGYGEANELNSDRTGKGLMRQAANIAPGIVEVEELLLGGGDEGTILEGHPELCFRAFAEGHLAYGKRTAPGMAERLNALRAVPEYEPGTWRALAESLGALGHGTGTDDLLDALCLALTARAPKGELQTLPTDPESDPRGLPMQMVYRRPEPFDVEA